MLMTLFIRRVTLSEQYGTKYLIDMSRFLGEDLPAGATTALFDLFQAGQIFRDQRKFILTRAETNNFRIHIPNENSIEGFTSLATVKKDFFVDIITQQTNYNDLIAKSQIFFEYVGWTMHSLKYIEYEIGDYNPEISNYTKYPMNFYVIEDLYNRASSL